MPGVTAAQEAAQSFLQESQPPISEAAPELRLRGLGVRAPDENRLLVGPLDMVLAGGRWTALLGRSGAGKSSILRAIAGLVEPARLLGSVDASDGATLEGRIAWMAQDPLLAPWLSVKANVAFGARFRGETADRAAIARALAAVGLEAYADRAPDTLSGGERQRVALARTLYEDRPVALLDEPFSALDALTRESASTLAAARLAGRTVLHVTHDPFEAARLADRVLILAPDGGSVVEAPFASGPPPRAADAPETFELAAELRRALAALEKQP